MRASIVVVTAVVLVACGRPAEQKPAASEHPASDRPLSVYVVNNPLAAFAERIGGSEASVTFPAPADTDPASWSPDGDTVAAYQGADLILLNGADYAKWVARASLPSAKLVDTGAAYEERLIPLEDAVTHTHGPEGEHAHSGVAFTTWLDPTLAVEQARAIGDAFEKARPEGATGFKERLALLEADLMALDTRLEAVAEAFGDRPVLFSHPVYQYLERRYGLNGRSVHWEPGAEPSAREWSRIETLLETHAARWMVWEGEPLAPVAARLEALGVASVVFDPCATRSESGDFVSAMDSNVDRLEAAWAGSQGSAGTISRQGAGEP